MLADVPHLLKNIRNAFMNNGKVYIHPDYVKEANLVSNVADFDVLRRLHKFTEENELKIAPHLTETALNPKPFEKMKVNLARAIFSKETSTAIQLVVKEYPDKFTQEDLTTAFFIENVADW